MIKYLSKEKVFICRDAINSDYTNSNLETYFLTVGYTIGTPDQDIYIQQCDVIIYSCPTYGSTGIDIYSGQARMSSKYICNHNTNDLEGISLKFEEVLNNTLKEKEVDVEILSSDKTIFSKVKQYLRRA
ncbi:hypothetical protein [Labilibaculum antarcticum]|nr:hypothetical protein [Labilibaculum antarcticum]